MPRKGKKTLYLDLDAIDSIQESLDQLPGNPSVSSYLNDCLPLLALSLKDLVRESKRSSLRGAAEAFRQAADGLLIVDDQFAEIIADPNPNYDVPLDKWDVPPKKSKSRKSKK